MTEPHKLASIFPPMKDDEYTALRDSIKEIGQQNAITLYEDQILDGIHRHRACEELGIEPRYEQLADGVSPVRFVLSQNMERRHLTVSQRAMIADSISAWSKHGGDRQSASLHLDETDIEEAATVMGVSARTVKDARKVREWAIPEVAEAVRAGDVSVSDAAVISGEPEDVQTQAIAAVLVAGEEDRYPTLAKAVGDIKREERSRERERLEEAAKSEPYDIEYAVVMWATPMWSKVPHTGEND